jgi:hypothetical protein
MSVVWPSMEMSKSKESTKDRSDLHLEDDELAQYQTLLTSSDMSIKDNEELSMVPLFWWNVKKHLENSNNDDDTLKQYAVLGHEVSS